MLLGVAEQAFFLRNWGLKSDRAELNRGAKSQLRVSCFCVVGTGIFKRSIAPGLDPSDLRLDLGQQGSRVSPAIESAAVWHAELGPDPLSM